MIFKIFALVIFILYHARLLVLGENYIKSLKAKSSRSFCPTIPNVQENKEGQREAAQLPTVRTRSCAWPQPVPARAIFTDPHSTIQAVALLTLDHLSGCALYTTHVDNGTSYVF